MALTLIAISAHGAGDCGVAASDAVRAAGETQGVERHRMTGNRALPSQSAGISSLLALLLMATPAKLHAQSFPSNPIRIVAPTTPGGLPDVISRIFATALTESEGWRVVVENRPGALMTLAMNDVLKQPADGHAIYPLLAGAMATPTLLPGMTVQIDRDFAPVVRMSTSYLVLVANPSVPARSVPELVSLLKGQPDKFNISVGFLGTPGHLLAEALRLQTGVRATIVPYQQMQQRVGDLLGGTTHFGFFPTPMAVNLIAAGKLRALAVTAPKRIAALSDIPTIAEQGFPELAAEDWYGLLVKSGTPSEIVARLNQAANKVLARQEVRAALDRLGAEPVGGTPAEFASLIQSQLVYWGNVARQAGVKLPE
jgi:tripartite-type tricarboxylate transporter receptor subunit TctC